MEDAREFNAESRGALRIRFAAHGNQQPDRESRPFSRSAGGESGAHGGGDADSARPARPLQRALARQPGAAGSQQLRAASGFCVEAVFEDGGAEDMASTTTRARIRAW